VRDGEGETIALFALDQLAVEEIIGNVLVVSSCPLLSEPVVEMGGDGVEAVGRYLQTVEPGVASAGEVLVALLAAEVLLDVVLDASFAAADEGVDGIISDAEDFA